MRGKKPSWGKETRKWQAKVWGCPPSPLESKWPSALDSLENPAQKQRNCHHWALLWTFMRQYRNGSPFVTGSKFINTVSPRYVVLLGMKSSLIASLRLACQTEYVSFLWIWQNKLAGPLHAPIYQKQSWWWWCKCRSLLQRSLWEEETI